MAETTPVTLLTGPGTARLLPRLLGDPSFRRTAFLLGEASRLGTDHPMVRPFNGAVPHFTAGCRCCGPGGELARALRAMLPAARRGEIDRVLIETADPAVVRATFTGDSLLAAIYHLSGIVAAVDTDIGVGEIGPQNAAGRQIAAADIIVVSTFQPTAVALLSALNPAARIIETEHDPIDLTAILCAGRPSRLLRRRRWQT